MDYIVTILCGFMEEILIKEILPNYQLNKAIIPLHLVACRNVVRNFSIMSTIYSPPQDWKYTNDIKQ